MKLESLILPVNKPAGWTSFDVVAKLRGGLRWKKVGHAGTLDPPATGLLLILFGDATQRTEEFMSLEKEYVATICLGVRTSTDDAEGEIISRNDVISGASDIEDALKGFVGSIQQTPPAVSAVKVKGRRSYELARKGNAVELSPREVHVHEISLCALAIPNISVRVRCSRGTYIRSIARDLGERLGCGGSLSSLTRTKIGRFDLSHAWPIDELLRQPEFRGTN
ncbi:tRNA pseudouridine(55) synthase TruB [bacterium]|nr:tRNA pseudouridine(55) synthase TruB [bacterium]